MNIAIIGAGLAGITLANELNEKGLNTTVFEKSRGKGGRASSKRLSFTNVDTGAQYFTVRDERFELAAERWKKQGHIAKWEFQPLIADTRNDHTYLKESSDDVTRFVGTPTMNAFIKHQAKNLNVQLNTEISGIVKKENQWQLWSGQEGARKVVGSFDWVVTTTPAEQAYVLFDNTPEIQNRIPQTIHAPCWALVIATKGLVPEQIQGFFGDEHISWVSRDSSKPNRVEVTPYGTESDVTAERQKPLEAEYHDVWVLHFSEKWTRENETMSEQEMESFGFDWLSTVLNNTVLLQPRTYDQLDRIRLKKVHSYRHFWRYARFDERHDIPNDIIIDSQHKAAVIGDWCYGGRIEKAYLSGLECAEQIMLEL